MPALERGVKVVAGFGIIGVDDDLRGPPGLGPGGDVFGPCLPPGVML